MTELLTLRDTATRLGWPVGKLRRLAKTGRVPCVRIERRYYFRAADMDAWVTKHTVVIQAPAAPRLDEDFTVEAGAFAKTFR